MDLSVLGSLHRRHDERDVRDRLPDKPQWHDTGNIRVARYVSEVVWRYHFRHWQIRMYHICLWWTAQYSSIKNSLPLFQSTTIFYFGLIIILSSWQTSETRNKDNETVPGSAMCGKNVTPKCFAILKQPFISLTWYFTHVFNLFKIQIQTAQIVGFLHSQSLSL